MTKSIQMILAVSENGVIGVDNDIPWKVKGDMQYFKDTTTGHPTIMGRKTFESIGSKPLPNRPAIVLTRDPNYNPDNTIVVGSIREAIEWVPDDTTAFIIGGGAIYKEAMSLGVVDVIHLTLIHTDVDISKGDITYFSLGSLCSRYWCEESRVDGHKDLRNDYDYTISKYTRWELC
jgi:dihydrofolate reductase